MVYQEFIRLLYIKMTPDPILGIDLSKSRIRDKTASFRIFFRFPDSRFSGFRSVSPTIQVHHTFSTQPSHETAGNQNCGFSAIRIFNPTYPTIFFIIALIIRGSNFVLAKECILHIQNDRQTKKSF